MRTICTLSALVGFLVLPPNLARAEDADSIADVRCVVVGMRFAEMTDPGLQSSGRMLALYYIGRLDGRTPKLDIEKLMVQEITRMSDVDYSTEGQRCGSSLTEKGKEITRIGKDMIERGRAMLDKPDSSTT